MTTDTQLSHSPEQDACLHEHSDWMGVYLVMHAWVVTALAMAFFRTEMGDNYDRLRHTRITMGDGFMRMVQVPRYLAVLSQATAKDQDGPGTPSGNKLRQTGP